MLNPILAFGAAALFAAPQTLEEIQAKIAQMEREVESERQMLQSESSRSQSWTVSSTERLENLRIQAQRAWKESDSLSKEKDYLIGQRESVKYRQQHIDKVLETLAARVADQVDSIASQMEREELPSIVESKSKELREISRGLRAGLIKPEEGLARGLDQVGELIDLGSKVSVKPGSFQTKSGLTLSGQFVRAGGIFEGFVSDNGELGAYRRRSAEGDWQWNETLTAEHRQQLKKVASMLREGEQPGFAHLPLGLTGAEEL
jgi:hypothetical protein